MCRTRGGNEYAHDAACFGRWANLGKAIMVLHWGLWILAVARVIPWTAFFLVMVPFWALLVSSLWFTRK